MFRKVIVFGFFFQNDKKKKKSKDCVPGSGFGLRVGSGTAVWAITLVLPLRPSIVQLLLLMSNCNG